MLVFLFFLYVDTGHSKKKLLIQKNNLLIEIILCLIFKKLFKKEEEILEKVNLDHLFQQFQM